MQYRRPSSGRVSGPYIQSNYNTVDVPSPRIGFGGSRRGGIGLNTVVYDIDESSPRPNLDIRTGHDPRLSMINKSTIQPLKPYLQDNYVSTVAVRRVFKYDGWYIGTSKRFESSLS